MASNTKQGWIELIQEHMLQDPGHDHQKEYHPYDGQEIFVGWKSERIGRKTIMTVHLDYEEFLKIDGFGWDRKPLWDEIEYMEFKYSKPPSKVSP